MKTDGYTRICGLIGNPVEHTVSPVIHNTLADAFALNLVYVPFRVEQERVEEAVRGAYALNLLGCNVTVPYKSRVMPYLKEIDPLAERIGAVNTLVRIPGGFKGYNTDMPGLYRAMCEDGVEIAGKKALVLGAGGVARAVALLLWEKGAESITLLNRTLEKAERIAGEINGLAGRPVADAMEPGAFASLPADVKYLAVQATNLGMFPDTEGALIEDPAFYRRIHTGYELIFNPSRTKFMKLVEENGGRAFGGLKMLLYQGIIAFELWTGKKIDAVLAAEVYAEMQKAMGLKPQGVMALEPQKAMGLEPQKAMGLEP